MSDALDIDNNARCLCGSGQKWKQCHGSRTHKRFALERDDTIDEFLLLLSEQCTRALEEVICDKRIDLNNKARILAEGVVLTVAARMCRSGKALMTLLYAGQSGEAYALGRTLFDSWISTLYYIHHQRRATLFAAFQAIKQERQIRKIAEYAPEYAAYLMGEPFFQRIQSEAVERTRRFPDLANHRRKATAPPKIREPLDTVSMFPGVVQHFMKTTTFPRAAKTQTQKRAYILEQLGQAYWSYSVNASQELHHTPMTLNTTLDILPNGEVTIRCGYLPPNQLAVAYINMIVDVLPALSKYRGYTITRHRIASLQYALRENRRRLKIETKLDHILKENATRESTADGADHRRGRH